MAKVYRDIPWDIEKWGWRYHRGSAGIGGYTIKADDEGWYYSFFLRPAGQGVRSRFPEYYKYVERKTGKRRTRKACSVRSQNLARGKLITSGVKGSAKRGEPGTAYCMKEKKTVHVNFKEEIEAKNGRIMIRGNCSDCGTKVQKYGRLVLCANCGQKREGRENDYLCVYCRAE